MKDDKLLPSISMNANLLNDVSRTLDALDEGSTSARSRPGFFREEEWDQRMSSIRKLQFDDGALSYFCLSLQCILYFS